VYRFKYNFNAAKNPIVRFKRIAFTELKRIDKGFINEKKRQYAFVLISTNSKKSEGDHIYAALDFSKELVDQMLEVIDKALKQHQGGDKSDFVIKETSITRQQSFTSGIINKLGGGFYNKRKQQKGQEMTRSTTTTTGTGTSPTGK